MALLLILLLVAAAVAVLIWQPWRTAASDPDPSGSAPAAPTDTATPEATASGTPRSTPTPSGTATVAEACNGRDLIVEAVTDKDSYGAGELPQLSISLTNDGETDCLIDVGTATQRFVITSGSDEWWNSAHCQIESANQVETLTAGQTVTTVEPIVWDRTRSSTVTCAEGEDRPSAPGGGAYYNLTVTIGGITSDDKAFELR